VKCIFVDTSAWVAVVDRADQHHAAAAGFYRGIFQRYRALVTTNLVVAETYVLLRRALGLEPALGWWKSISTSPRVEVLYASPDEMHSVLAVLRKFSDHPLSLTDAHSFVTMRQRRIEDAFAFDAHFTLAGFTRLP